MATPAQGRASDARPLLVGESNPYSSDPSDALLPYPARSAGARLCRMLGCGEKTYLRSFDRVNLLGSQRWIASVARCYAAELKADRPRGDFILLGSKVASAFGLPFAPWTSWNRSTGTSADEGSILVLPHPSGLSREWNKIGAVESLRALLGSYLR